MIAKCCITFPSGWVFVAAEGVEPGPHPLRRPGQGSGFNHFKPIICLEKPQKSFYLMVVPLRP